MDISMIGIDHNLATIEEREIFSFTKAEAVETMQKWNSENESSGSLILSTCNRTELWVSGKADAATLFAALCQNKNIAPENFKHLVVYREGDEAVSHLFQMACGIKSKINGEDQILSQIREALTLARTHKCDDMVIEKVFQTAISAAKKVKTDVRFETANPSAAKNAIDLIQEHFGEVKGLNCLVIGNGQMGSMVATMLSQRHANVSMTLRKRFHGKDIQDSKIIVDCKMIEYEERFNDLYKYQVVISATISPHYTITFSDIKDYSFGKSLWIDMAVPRDIDKSIGEIDNITLVDMDQLADYKQQDYLKPSVKKIMAILKEYQDELYTWFAFREHVDDIKHISFLVKDDAVKRVNANLKALKLDQDISKDVKISIDIAIEKAAEKILFGLRDNLDEEDWPKCFLALKKSAERETLKR